MHTARAAVAMLHHASGLADPPVGRPRLHGLPGLPGARARRPSAPKLTMRIASAPHVFGSNAAAATRRCWWTQATAVPLCRGALLWRTDFLK